MSEEITVEQATTEINAMFFPEVQENEIAWHAGYRFIYRSNTWEQEDE